MIIAVLGAFLASAAEAECPKVVSIEGPPEVLAELRPFLRERGVSDVAGGSCPILQARVDRSEGAYRITIRDPWGRTVERTAKSIGTVAALIVAWAEWELIEPAPVATPASARARLQTAALVPIQMGAPRSEPPPRLLISGGVEVGAPLETAIPVIGPHLGVCVLFEPACLGAAVRYARAGERQTVDLLLEAGLRIVSDRVSFKPTVGVGAGWYHGSNRPPMRVYTQWTYPDARPLSVLAEVGVIIGVRLVGQLHLLLGGSATAAWSATWYQPFGFHEESSVVRGQLGVLWGAL